MSTHDYVIDNQSASAFRADLNSVLSAIVTQNANATAPVTTYANMIWYDTTNNQIKKRNEANSAWVTLGTIDETAGTFTPSGGAAIASQLEAETGTDNTKMMTPLRVAQAMRALTIDIQEFTASGTWTKPTNAIYSEILVVGGGQGGSYGQPSVMCNPAIAGKAGNSGGTGSVDKIASALGTTETVTIGAGGTISTTAGGNGGTGGTSSFGTHVSATGGGSAGPGIGSGTNAYAQDGLFADSSSIGAPSTVGYGGYLNTRTARKGAGGGGGGTTAVASAGGAGYVRVVTYCS